MLDTQWIMIQRRDNGFNGRRMLEKELQARGQEEGQRGDMWTC